MTKSPCLAARSLNAEAVPDERAADGKPDGALHGLRRRKGALAIVCVAVTAVAFVLVGGRVLAGAAWWFHVNDPAASDVLVLLLGGVDHRPAKVADLYKERIAPRVVYGTAQELRGKTDPGADESRLVLERGGVPRGAIEVLPQVVQSTRDEALAVRAYVRTHSVRRITVVTTSFHTARARWIFGRVLRGTGVEVHMAAVEHPRFDEGNWFRSAEGIRKYRSELIKTIGYHLLY